MISFDDTDERIISILSVDARVSNREVARDIGISEAAVRKRLKRLANTGAAKISAVINPAAVGLEVAAFLRLQTAPSGARAVVENAAKLECVSFAALTTGRFNVIVLVSVRNRAELAELVHTHFRCWEGVHGIETIELVSTAKHRLDLILIAPPMPEDE